MLIRGIPCSVLLAVFLEPKIQLKKKEQKTIWLSFVPSKFKNNEVFLLIGNKFPCDVYIELILYVLAEVWRLVLTLESAAS